MKFTNILFGLVLVAVGGLGGIAGGWCRVIILGESTYDALGISATSMVLGWFAGIWCGLGTNPGATRLTFRLCVSFAAGFLAAALLLGYTAPAKIRE